MATSTLQHRQLDLFGAHLVTKRRPPMTPEKLAGMALGIWRASGRVVDGPGAAFFHSRRLAVPGSDVVRFHPSLKFGNERAPGLVFLLRDKRTGEVCGCMRVYLDPETGWAIAKRPIGRCWGSTINRAPVPR